MRLALSEMEAGSSSLQAIEPPTARTEAIHRRLAAAAAHYHEGTRLIERALDDFDADLLDRGASAIRTGVAATDRAPPSCNQICTQTICSGQSLPPPQRRPAGQ